MPVDNYFFQNRFSEIPRPPKQDGVNDSEFTFLPPDEAMKLFDQDGEDRLRLNNSTLTSFSNSKEMENVCG